MARGRGLCSGAGHGDSPPSESRCFYDQLHTSVTNVGYTVNVPLESENAPSWRLRRVSFFLLILPTLKKRRLLIGGHGMASSTARVVAAWAVGAGFQAACGLL